MPEYHRPIEIHGGGGEKSGERLTENGALRHLREAIILFICAEERGFLFGGDVGGGTSSRESDAHYKSMITSKRIAQTMSLHGIFFFLFSPSGIANKSGL